MTAGGLFDHHRKFLADRAVSDAVAEARGYSSTTLKDWLRDQGFSQAVSARVPGLVIPVRDVHGEARFCQYRPDHPRVRDGKPAKYEIPARTRLVIDVPPAVLGKLSSPARPLWITEGPVKADAATSAGLACVGMFGVFGWRGLNHRGGRTALPDWESIALDGREVYLAPDSDVRANPAVITAVTRLGAMLGSRGADVRYVYLPVAADGGKTGLDDWLARNGPDIGGLLTLADEDPPARPKRTAAPQRTKVPVPADPAALLGELRDWLCAYVAFPSAHHAVAVTLWTVHTHLAARFDATGRLVLLSPEPECGKTRVLELLELACAGAEMLNDASAAYMFRRIGTEDAGPVTLLLDEADAIWKRGKGDESAEALRSIINAGHRKGATVGRVEMNSHDAKLTRFPVYAPAALAAKGAPLPDTIMSRAVVVRMRRRAPGQQVRRYRQRITRPEGEALRDRIVSCAESVAAKVGDPWPDLPDGIDDRPADVWEPLITVADLAGGDWPKLARDACTALVKGAREDAESTGILLLADLRDVFGASDGALLGHAEVLFTSTILKALAGLEEASWGGWNEGKGINARDLAKHLKPYGITSRQVRIGASTAKGYRRADLADALSRYVPPGGSETSETSETPLASHVSPVSDVSHTPDGAAWPEDTIGAEAHEPDDNPPDLDPEAGGDDEYPF